MNDCIYIRGENKMEKRAQIIYAIIIILPLIDMATAFTEQWMLSVGAIIRTLFIVGSFLYLWQVYYKQEQRTLGVFLFAYFMIASSLILNYFTKEPFLLVDEVSFILKASYYVIIVWITTYVITTKPIQNERLLQATNWALMIIGIAYWLAFITNTNIKSYAYIKSGYSGWYFSANEFSVIMLILFALVLIQFLLNPSHISFIAILLALTIFPMIGTKTALYGAIILFIPMILYSITTKKRLQMGLLSVLFGLFLIYIPFTAAQANNAPETKDTELAPESTQYGLLSSRDVYLQDTLADFKNASIPRQLFGLGYAGDYDDAPKTIEMDFYEMFFSFGIIGTIALVIPLLYLSYSLIRFKMDFLYIYRLGTLALVMAIAFVAGHVLFAPAVITYVALLAISTGMVANE